MTVASKEDPTRSKDAREPEPGSGKMAAWQAISQNTVRLELSGLCVLTLPSPQNLAFLGGVGAIAAAGLLEWPVAALLAAGHLLAEDHHHRCLADFGEALSEA